MTTRKLISCFTVFILIICLTLCPVTRLTVHASSELSANYIAFAEIVSEEEAKYGHLEFDDSTGFIKYAKNLIVIELTDLDKDSEDELITAFEYEDENGFYNYGLEVWDYNGSSAECIYSGDAYKMGADNQSMYIMRDAEENLYLYLDDETSMNGKYVARDNNGIFEYVYQREDIFDYPEYNSETGATLIDGTEYFEYKCTYFVAYSDDDSWENNLKSEYASARSRLGLEGLSQNYERYSRGISSILDDNYHLTKMTTLDSNGFITAVWTYEYDENGNELRSWRNDILRTECTYAQNGQILTELHWNDKGNLTFNETYDENGNLLEKYEYTDGRVSWEYSFTYNSDGKIATSYQSVQGNRVYYYNENGALVEIDNVDEHGNVTQYHEVQLDSEGRESVDYLHKDGGVYLFETIEYFDDGSKKENFYNYRTTDENGDFIYVENGELGYYKLYDANGREIEFVDGSSGDYTEYDSEGNEIRKESIRTYHTETVTTERDSFGNVSKRNKHYYIHTSAETREFDYDSYISEYDGYYKIHAYIYTCDEPLSNSEFYLSSENYYLYENRFGDTIGIDYVG